MTALTGIRAATVTVVALATLSACTAAQADAEPVTLRIATDDVESTPAGAAILAFADEVAQRSDGVITIEPVWHAAGDVDEWDQANGRLVSAGDVELGLIPARAWDVEGVMTLRALHAPFLITSNEAVTAVLTDDELVADAMAGLADVGVTGIDLIPEGLRHPVGFGAPLLGVEDYAGQLIRTPRSDTGEALFEALGASTTESEFDRLRGSEVSFALANDGVATANVVFFPKIHSLVANTGAWEDLSGAQRSVLSDAARATRDRVIAEWPTENDAAAAFCDAGGELAAASEAQLTDLLRAAQPVHDDLREDASTADLMAAIEAVVARTPAEPPVTACDSGPSAEAASFLNGSYTVEVTPDDFAAAEVTDPKVIGEYGGVRTIELTDGDYVIGYGDGSEWSGAYDVVGDRLIWHWTSAAEDWTEADVVVQPDGSLVFSNWADGGGGDWLGGAEVLFSTWVKTT